MNREEIKSLVTTLNSSIEDFNLRIDKYEQKGEELNRIKEEIIKW